AILHLFNGGVRPRTAAGDAVHERGHVRGRFRATVGEKQDGSLLLGHGRAPCFPFRSMPSAWGREYLALACFTKSTRAITFSTGVSGRMPWPRLKMCPGRPPAWRKMLSARASNSFWPA